MYPINVSWYPNLSFPYPRYILVKMWPIFFLISWLYPGGNSLEQTAHFSFGFEARSPLRPCAAAAAACGAAPLCAADVARHGAGHWRATTRRGQRWPKLLPGCYPPVFRKSHQKLISKSMNLKGKPWISIAVLVYWRAGNNCVYSSFN